MTEQLLIEVRYTIRTGKKDEFLQKIEAAGIAKASRMEEGNLKYEYYQPEDSEDALCLTEIWINEEAQKEHGSTPHYMKLAELKKEYVVDTKINRSFIEHEE